MYNMTEKMEQFEQQMQHFMTDISELVINAVCTRINEKPRVYVPKIMDQITELNELTKDHIQNITNLNRTAKVVSKIDD